MKYRIPIVFTSVLVLFMMGVTVLDRLATKEPKTTQVTQQISQVGTTPKNTKEEMIMCPVESSIGLVRYFYEEDGTHNQEALDLFEGVYRQSQGVDYADKQTFDVMASLSGVVSEVKKDPILGVCVTIDCENDIQLIYQSLSNVSLKEGESVLQGSVIGSSGYNIYEADLGNHVHFTIQKDGTARNPLDLYNETASQIE